MSECGPETPAGPRPSFTGGRSPGRRRERRRRWPLADALRVGAGQWTVGAVGAVGASVRSVPSVRRCDQCDRGGNAPGRRASAQRSRRRPTAVDRSDRTVDGCLDSSGTFAVVGVQVRTVRRGRPTRAGQRAAGHARSATAGSRTGFYIAPGIVPRHGRRGRSPGHRADHRCPRSTPPARPSQGESLADQPVPVGPVPYPLVLCTPARSSTSSWRKPSTPSRATSSPVASSTRARTRARTRAVRPPGRRRATVPPPVIRPPSLPDSAPADDGLHSAVRRLAFGPETRRLRHLGVYVGFVGLPEGHAPHEPGAVGATRTAALRRPRPARARTLGATRTADPDRLRPP
jgi:hypothetical protein